MSNISSEDRISQLELQLEEAQRTIRSLNVAVRTEELKVKISSEYSNFALWEYDIAEDICYQYRKLDGKHSEDLSPIVHFRESVLSWGLIYKDDIALFHKMCDDMERGAPEIHCDVRTISDSGELVWFRYEGKTVNDDNGKPTRIIGRTLDVTAEKGGTGVSSDSRRDRLTGALTAEAFRSDAIARIAEVRGNTNAALVLLGVDNFSAIREEYGAEYSDNIQISLAKIISNHIAAEHGSFFGRIKNGVFGLLMNFEEFSSVEVFCESLIGDFNSVMFLYGMRFSLSGGVALGKSTKHYDEAFKEAYCAMRAARACSETYKVYKPEMACGDNFIPFGEDTPIDETTPEEADAKLLGIYQCLARALMEDKESASVILKTMRLAAKYIGASHVYMYEVNEDCSSFPHLVWSSDGTKEYSDSLPMVKAEFSDISEFSQILSRGGEVNLNVRSGKVSESGFSLVNGAAVGICHAITVGDRIIGYFCYVSDIHRDWRKNECRLLENIRDALCRMYELYLKGNLVTERSKISEVAIDTMSIESFAIAPDTYRVDYIGTNASGHYNLKNGDICYKKIYGYDAPCPNCPVQQLKEGSMRASVARYDDRSKRWVNITAVEDDSIRAERRYYIFANDITNYMGQLQSVDTLTGAMTFDKFTAEAARMMMVYSPDRFLCVVSIANFRRLNEERGYEFGNSILVMVAELIGASLANDEMLCRSDGSRFIMMISNSNSDELVHRLDTLLRSIQKQVYDRLGSQIYLLVGAYQMAEENIGVMSSIDRAMRALKTIRNRSFYNGNLIALYDDELRSELQSRQYIEEHMLEALDNDEFKVFYQPKVSVETGRVVGAEALVRWIRPDGEMIPPGKFVPLFEENGFIADMDFAIYRRAIADIKRWMRCGYDVPLISLNVSRHHLKDDSFPKKLNSLVDALGVPHEKIELEITESMLAENLNTLVEIMKELKSTGFRISVDDFGSGYSSLNLITLLPFDTLKIDGGFFLRNKLTEKNKTVISSVVKLAKSLNLETVSEGVETDEQVEFLRELGCDMIQGYYFYRPMPMSDFEAIISGK
ncbi:MAG: EAL domain-containing protein [Oscillospiraceae bacterium]